MKKVWLWANVLITALAPWARAGARVRKNAFREALADILEQTFGVEVLNVCEYDDDGEVFCRPDQIELDVIIRNGLVILCELKSSIDKADMCGCERKARFYERRRHRQVNRLIVIALMIDSRALEGVKRLGTETCGEPEQVSDSHAIVTPWSSRKAILYRRRDDCERSRAKALNSAQRLSRRDDVPDSKASQSQVCGKLDCLGLIRAP